MAKRTEHETPAGTLADEDHKKFFENLERGRSESQKAAGDCGATLKQYEKLGGHKKALTTAYSLKQMGVQKATDFYRSLKHLVEVLGLVQGPDLVDAMEADTESAKPAAAKPARKARGRAEARVAKVKDKTVARAADKAAADLAKPSGNVIAVGTATMQ